MNRSARWKEDRIRERIYLEQLKHTETLPNRAGLNGASSSGGTPEVCLQQTSGRWSPNRRKRNRLPWNVLRVALLAAWAALCAWFYLAQFGIHS